MIGLFQGKTFISWSAQYGSDVDVDVDCVAEVKASAGMVVTGIRCVISCVLLS